MSVELLSPAGDFECLRAAVQSGADSIYFGSSHFNARSGASNFDLNALEEAIIYAKIRNVKTYLTLNTLIKDEEFHDAISLASKAYEFGIDAIIIQDLGLASYLIKHFPDLPIHASTQMTVHNLQGVLELQKLGFQRVVLSRELSLDEIKHICENTTMEIETFIHGALCISYSGQCLFSSMIGGRSGNRGRCAQPCRLPYELLKKESINKNKNKEIVKTTTLDKGYLLSPRDLCGLEFLPNLINSGITSFKIEGRMKSPEYVAIVTRIYRKYIDLALSDQEYEIEEIDKKALLQVFNRGGFSSGHLDNEPNQHLIFKDKPNNMGLYLGNVAKYNSNKGHITLNLNENLSIGDTICAQNEMNKYTISEMMLNSKNITTGFLGQSITIGRMKGNINIGDKLYKMSSKELTLSAKETLKESCEFKKIPFSCILTIKENTPIQVNIKSINETDSIYNDINLTITSEIVPEKANNQPITVDRIISQISKTKNTPYIFQNIDVILEDNLFIPSISTLNELRRTIIHKIETIALTKMRRKKINILDSVNSESDDNLKLIDKKEHTKVSLLLNILKPSYDYSALTHVDRLYIPLVYFINKEYKSLITSLSDRFDTYIYLPCIIRDNYKNLTKVSIENTIELYDIKGFVLSNISQLNNINILKQKYPERTFEFISNYTFNIYNQNSMKQLYDFGVSSICLSPELDKKSLIILTHMKEQTSLKKKPLKELIVYGNLPLMTSNYCLLGKSNMCYPTCNSNCKGDSEYYLKDRLGFEFRVLQNNIQMTTNIYNSKTTSISNKDFSTDYCRIDILDEDIDQINKIIDIVRSGKRLEGNNYTNGNLNREI